MPQGYVSNCYFQIRIIFFLWQVTVGILACITPITPFLSITVPASTFTTVTPVSITTAQCVYSDWTNWTSCTVTCGQGTQTHARNILAGFCTEPLIETRICQMEPCPCIFTQAIYISTFQKLPPADSEY
jgi:hypothetical protein